MRTAVQWKSASVPPGQRLLSYFLKGSIIGLSIAAPVGPIGLLCIRRSLAEGRGMGLATGLGAATADALYGAVAGFGLAIVSDFLVAQRGLLGIVGGLFLCYLGIRTFLAKPAQQTQEVRASGLGSAYAATFVLTMTNPMTILSFVAVFAGLGLAASPNYFAATLLVFGVFVGSALWWLFLSTVASLFRSRITPAWMRGVNRLSGAIILAFGLYALSDTIVRTSY
jgi:threonine/homoserine/homoserine lactone efflux protein